MVFLTKMTRRVTRHSANAIDHSITNSVTSRNEWKSAIIKTELWEHFPIVFAFKTNKKQKPVVKSTYKRSYCEVFFDKFKTPCTTEIGMTFKSLKAPIKHIDTFLISLLTLTTSRSQKPTLNLNLRVIKALGLLKLFQNFQRRRKESM